MTSDHQHRSSQAIDNLRAVVILLVIAFHSALAYLSFLPSHPFALDAAPFMWRSFPVVDQQRWLGFDLFCAWLDVFLMSFFFLLSGLFVWPSLQRKGARAFLLDRLVRLSLPFAAVVLLLMPLAHYPVYLETARDPAIADFWRRWLALPLWPAGPMWFLWLLLAGDAIAAGVYRLIAGRGDAPLRLSFAARRHPARFLAGVIVLSALAYVPLALLFGPMRWAQWGPFSLQLGRPAHYALYFLAGAAIGACGIERGLAAADGPLARRWSSWLLAAVPLFALWVGLTAVTRDISAAPLWLRALDDLSFVGACFASCFAALALALRCGGRRSPVLASLKDNAYGMYLVHYVFVVWLQYGLQGAALPAVVKMTLVFGGALSASWGASAALRRIPAVAAIIGGGRRVARPPREAAVHPKVGIAD